MKSWRHSQKYLSLLSRMRWGVFGMVAVTYVPLGVITIGFTKNRVWDALFHARPVSSVGIAALLSLIAVFPVLMVWFQKKFLERAGATTITFDEGGGEPSVTKFVPGDSISMPISALKEIRVLKLPDGKLGRVRLVAPGRRSIDVDHLENFEEFLDVIKNAAPLSLMRLWEAPAYINQIFPVAMGLTALISFLAFRRIISMNVVAGVALVFVFGFRALMRRYQPLASGWNAASFSAQLGPRFFWMDLLFAGFIFGLSAVEGLLTAAAIREGHCADLLRLLFIPIILLVSFVIPLIGHIRQMPKLSRRKSYVALAIMLMASLGFAFFLA